MKRSLAAPCLLAVLLLSTLAATPLAIAGAKAPPAAKAGPAGDDRAEIGSLRRTLISAMMLQRLQLTGDQKKALTAAIADAKKMKSGIQNDSDVDALREKRKAILRKAIDEARATGKLSAETRVAMEDLKDDAQDVRKEFKGEGKEVFGRLKDVFTDAQIEALQDLRDDVPGEEHHGGRGGDRHGKGGDGDKRGKRVFFHILMSDEFAAELAR